MSNLCKPPQSELPRGEDEARAGGGRTRARAAAPTLRDQATRSNGHEHE